MPPLEVSPRRSIYAHSWSGSSAQNVTSTCSKVEVAVGALTAMQIEYIGTDNPLLQSIWATRHNVSVYDAAYLTVAATHDAPLITFDARLAKAAHQVAPIIRVTLLCPRSVQFTRSPSRIRSMTAPPASSWRDSGCCQ